MLVLPEEFQIWNKGEENAGMKRLASIVFAVVLAFGLFPAVSTFPASGEEAIGDPPAEEWLYEGPSAGEPGPEGTPGEEPQSGEEPGGQEPEPGGWEPEPNEPESGDPGPDGDEPILPIARAEEDGLLLHYDMKTLTETNGQIVFQNVAGPPGFDGLLRNPANGMVVKNSEAGFVSFNTSSTLPKSYIEIPKAADGSDLLAGLTEITVSALIEWVDDGQNRWVFGFGTVSDDGEYGNKYFFFTPRHSNGNVMASGISRAGWRNEALVRGTSRLPAGDWKLVTVVFSEAAATITVYVDGALAFSGNAGDRKLSEIIDPGAPFSGFVAKSIFRNDPYYQGKIADFRVYGKALTETEVASLYAETSQLVPELQNLVLQDAADALDMTLYLGPGDESVDQVTKDLALPAVGKHGVAISWQSSDPSVISDTGAVTRPPADGSDVEVELTATLTYQGITLQKTFAVQVLKAFDDTEAVSADAAKLVIYNQNNIKGNIRLPVAGENGTTIRWTSSHPHIVKGSPEAEAAGDPAQLGRVARPEDADTAVTLTATVSKGNASVQRTFDLVVRKKPEPLEYDAYFFAYFTGEYEGGEEISFAVAEDPLKWRALNNGKSVLQSTMGEMGVRDPFIIRSPEGDKFYLLATDLKMGESTNFDQAQITGSHHIMIWESDDLVHWSRQRMVEVAHPRAGNTWAPEAFYDETTGDYVVFWASSMKIGDTYGKYPNGRPAGQYNVMYYATTRDFYTFSEPKVFIDDAFPTIDTTIVEHNGTLYRFTKSEVNYRVYYEKAPHVFYDKDGIAANGFQWELIEGTRTGNQGLIGHGGNNEGPTVFKDIREDKWYLFLDSWPYHVRVSTDLEDGAQFRDNLLPENAYALPPGPRHGTVIPITRAEYEALVQAYGVPGPQPSAEPVVHYTFDPDDAAGFTIKDVSGNGHDALLVGGAEIRTDDAVEGGAVHLDGTTGYVMLPDNLIRDLNLEQMTVAAWVKVDRHQANQRIFDFASDTGRQVNRNTMYLSMQGDTGVLEFAIVTPFTEKFANESAPLASNYKYALRAGRPSAGAWHHIAVTIGGFDAVLYVDGEEAARSSVYNVEPRMLLETSMNYIGKSRRDAHPLLAGKIDDFRIYNRPLTAQEIAALAQAENGEPQPEDPTLPAPVLHYDLTDVTGETVRDRIGRFHGKWIGTDRAQLVRSENTGFLDFEGGSTASYVEIPGGVLDGLTDVTVSILINWKGQAGAEWAFALGRDRNRYLYFTPRYNAGDYSARFGIATNGWQNEVTARTPTLPANEWKLITGVMSGTEGKLTLYVDGVEVGSAFTDFTLEDIRNPGGISGYLARSFYAEDPYFGGAIAEFRIYGEALTPAQVALLKQEADRKIGDLRVLEVEQAAKELKVDDLLGSNAGKDEITADLRLPGTGKYGTQITWQSRSPEIISPQGKVNRPPFEQGNRTVVLTATISNGIHSVTREFTFTVIRLPRAPDILRMDAEWLKIPNLEDVRGHLTLPVRGPNGSAISWTSDKPDVISPTGELTRPAYGEGDTTVRLTATLTLAGISIKKGFVATVRQLPKPEPYVAYLFVYFTGEGKANGEQVYFALSDEEDPLHWTEMNNGAPALFSNLGEKGVRDPFIIRSPEGDKFYMIATDLKVYGTNNDWNRAARYGSDSIVVWESTDLVNWSEPWLAKIAPPRAGHTWAPEAFYDKTTGEYIVFWAAAVFDNDAHAGPINHSIWYARTRDFRTFTEPQIYMNYEDYGFPIIDTTMIEHNGKIYRFTKEEHGNAPFGRFVFQEAGNSVFDPDFRMIKRGIGIGTIARGEGPLIFKSITEDKWYLFIDEFGGRGYVPFETTDLDSGEWVESQNYRLPSSPRHGTVIPITASEYARLLQKVPGVKAPDSRVRVTGVSLDQTSVKLKVGQELQLLAIVTPFGAADKSVVWASSDDSVVSVDGTGRIRGLKEGTAYITVTTVDGQFVAIGEVTVEKATSPGGQPGGGGQPGTGGQPGGGAQPDEGAPSGEGDQPDGEDGASGGARPGPEDRLPAFSDMERHWAASAVQDMAARGIMEGYPDGTFRPDRNMTRAEFVAVLCRLHGLQPEEGDSAFGDVPAGAWYAKYVNALHRAGWISGYGDGTFRPDREITREEAFVLVWRIFRDRLEASVAGKTFTDEADISSWAQEAVRALAAAGAVTGYEDGSLRPKEPMTRAEAAAVLAALL